MDKKIILAVVIVAVIGVVAATYHVTDDENSIFNPLASVETEEDSALTDVASIGTGVSQQAENGASDNQVQTSSQASTKDSAIITSTSSENNKKTSDNAITTESEGSDSNTNSSISGDDSNQNSLTKKNNTVAAQKKNNTITPTSDTAISRSRAVSIAVSAAKNSGLSSVTGSVISTSGTGSSTVYVIAIYKNGKVVGEYEVNSKGRIVGGAIENEAPDTDSPTNNNNQTSTSNNQTSTHRTSTNDST